ncbi:MAG: hypothetical protein ACR2GP_05145, partial [Burkholderiaceae bacterium]
MFGPGDNTIAVQSATNASQLATVNTIHSPLKRRSLCGARGRCRTYCNSIAIAVASPPPMHSDAMPFLPPVVFN